MDDQLTSILSSWTPTTSPFPTSTVLTSINPTNTGALYTSLSNAIESIATALNIADVISLSYVVRGAQASMTAISAQQVLATATATPIQSEATQVLWDATLNLQSLKWAENLYSNWLSVGGNGLFNALFLAVFIVHTVQMLFLRYWYVGISLFCGCGLEWVGYLARTLAVNDTANQTYFLIQIIVLTIAPAFIMAGVYYYLAKLIVVHGKGRTFSIFRPTWYSYFFIFCDVFSLVLQAIGGGMAAQASSNKKDPQSGTDVMIAGIAFQVVSMSLFSITWIDFLHKIHFKANPEIKFTWKRFWALVVNGKDAYTLRQQLEPYYRPYYSDLRARPFFKWFPHGISLAIIFIYIRCIYRLVELAQGWSGFLITHEEYVLSLDAMVVFFAVLILTIIHPMNIFGKNQRIPLRNKNQAGIDDDLEEKHNDEDQTASISSGNINESAHKHEII